MPKHIHADLMLQYAQDAQESKTPWENWEINRGGFWIALLQGNPVWCEHYEYRRKPRTIVINGFTVNAPMDKEPGDDTYYYFPNLNSFEYCSVTSYASESDWDKLQFNRGLCFTNKEDAIAMAKAMLRIDPSK